MKKRVIISIVLLILAFSTCALSFAMMANEIGKLRGSLYDALFTAENYGISGSATDAVLCNWNNAKNTFDVFLNENGMSELERLIPSLSDSLIRRDVGGYLDICSECIGYLTALLDNITLNVGSIL